MIRTAKIFIFVVNLAIALPAWGDEATDAKLLEIFSEYKAARYHYQSPQNAAATREAEKEKLLALSNELLEHGDKLGDIFISSLRDPNGSSSDKTEILDFMRYHGMRVPELVEFSREIIEHGARGEDSSSLFVSSVQILAEFGGEEDLALLNSARDSMGFSRLLDLNVKKLERSLRIGKSNPLGDGRDSVRAVSDDNSRSSVDATAPSSETPAVEGSPKRSPVWPYVLVVVALVGIVVVLVRSRKNNTGR